MPFLAYVAIVLVSLSAILFEINWLTKPKLEADKPVAQVASTAVPPRDVTKIERAEPGPTPVIPVTPTVASAPTAAAPATPDQSVAIAKPEVATTPSILAAPAMAMPAPLAPPAPVAAPVSQPQVQQALATPNSCDVQGCAAAYQSFRAADCSYQPFEGPRRICEKPPEAGARQAAEPQLRGAKIEAATTVTRKLSRDEELRDVERAVRRITAGDDVAAGRGMGDNRVIVIERPARDW